MLGYEKNTFHRANHDPEEMSLRDRIAIGALPGCTAIAIRTLEIDPKSALTADDIAAFAYNIADAMLRRRDI